MQCIICYFRVKINYWGASQFVSVIMTFFTKLLSLFPFIPRTKCLYVFMNSLIHVCVLMVVWRSYNVNFSVLHVLAESLMQSCQYTYSMLYVFFFYVNSWHHTHKGFVPMVTLKYDWIWHNTFIIIITNYAIWFAQL